MTIHSRPAADDYRQNYDQIDWSPNHAGEQPAPRSTREIVVNGDPILVEAEPAELVEAVAQRALVLGRHLGRPLSDWELRMETGQLVWRHGMVSPEIGATTGPLYLSVYLGCGGEQPAQQNPPPSKQRRGHSG
jgi:hypothetical protein